MPEMPAPTITTSTCSVMAPRYQRRVEYDALRPHRAVALAGLAAMANNAELRQLWSAFMTAWVDYTAELITAERARGAAPDTIPARDLATALNLMNERVVFASQDTQDPTLPEDAALEALAHVWVASIYGAVGPADLSPDFGNRRPLFYLRVRKRDRSLIRCP